MTGSSLEPGEGHLCGRLPGGGVLLRAVATTPRGLTLGATGREASAPPDLLDLEGGRASSWTEQEGRAPCPAPWPRAGRRKGVLGERADTGRAPGLHRAVRKEREQEQRGGGLAHAEDPTR